MRHPGLLLLNTFQRRFSCRPIVHVLLLQCATTSYQNRLTGQQWDVFLSVLGRCDTRQRIPWSSHVLSSKFVSARDCLRLTRTAPGDGPEIAPSKYAIACQGWEARQTAIYLTDSHDDNLTCMAVRLN